MKERLFGIPGSVIDLLLEEDHLAAFAITAPKALSNSEVCAWRHGTIIDPEFQSRGLYSQLIQLSLTRDNPQWIATRTQNPRVYETWYKMFGDALYPHPDKTHDPTIQKIGFELAGGKHPFDPTTFVVQRAYTESRSGADYHRCREEWIRNFFEKRLGTHDAIILLVRVRA